MAGFGTHERGFLLTFDNVRELVARDQLPHPRPRYASSSVGRTAVRLERGLSVLLQLAQGDQADDLVVVNDQSDGCAGLAGMM